MFKSISDEPRHLFLRLFSELLHSIFIHVLMVYFKLLSRLVFSELAFLSSLLLYLTFYSVNLYTAQDILWNVYSFCRVNNKTIKLNNYIVGVIGRVTSNYLVYPTVTRY